MNAKFADKVCRMFFIFAFVLGTISVPGQSAKAQEYNPSIFVDYNQEAVGLSGWTIGTELTLTIDNPANGTGIDYTTSMILESNSRAFYLNYAFDIQPGDVVTVTDGITTKQVTVTDVRILGANPDTNIVYGTADPSYRTCNFDGYDVTTDQNGNWVADFTGICDLTGATTIIAAEQENGTTRFVFDMPTFTVYPQNNRVDSFTWQVGNEVTLTIDNPSNGVGVDYTDTKTALPVPQDPYGSYTNFDLGTFVTHSGDLVTMTDGITAKKTVVANLALGGGNSITDRVWGTADPGTVIQVRYRDDYSIFRNVIADTEGNWMADFSVPGDEPGEEALFDIQPDNVMLAIQKDGDGDQTQLETRASVNQPPQITSITAPITPVQLGQSINATVTFSDPDVGDTHTIVWNWGDGSTTTASAAVPSVTTSHTYTSAGVYTVTATITDAAGESDTDTATVTVLPWTLKGFYQPVDMNGVYNIVKGGSTVPLKFEIFAGPTELIDVADIKSLTSAEIICNANAVTDEIELTATGGTSLRYADGQFIYNWKTPKTAGKCYRVTMTTIDSSSLVAYFKLK
jgi:hypothetical protein